MIDHSPARAVASAVLRQAYEDLNSKPTPRYGLPRRYFWDNAKQFFFGEDDFLRRFWCDAAGVDVRAVVRKAREHAAENGLLEEQLEES